MSGENPLKIDKRYVLEQAYAHVNAEQYKSFLNGHSDEISPGLVSQITNYFLRGENYDGREEISKDFCDEICKMIDNSNVLEWLLYLTKKRYRDHFQHQFYVGTLGLIFLNTGITDGQITLKKYMAEKLGLVNEKSIEKSWWIASLLHDHAYPLSHLFSTMPVIVSNTNYNKSISELYNTYDLYDDELAKIFKGDRTQHAENLLKEHLYCFFNDEELSNLFNNKNNLNDHGIWGAVNIIAHMVTSGWPFFVNCLRCDSRSGMCCDSNLRGQGTGVCGKYDKDRLKHGILCLKQAIRAIAIHNCHDFAPIDIEKDPVAFLLVLCDEMQEWDRKTMIGKDVGVESEYIELDGIKKENGEMSFDSCLTIRFCFDANNLVYNDWDYRKFFESKRNAFKRLKVSDDFPLKKIDFRIEVPYNIEFSSTDNK